MTGKEVKEIGHINFGYFSPELSSSNTYPGYIEDNVLECVKKIQGYQNRNSITFGFVTDIHYSKTYNHDIRTKRLVNAYREIRKRVHSDVLILGGDYVNDGIKDYKLNNMRELRAHLGDEKYLPVNGNHDDNSIWDTFAEEAKRGIHQVTSADMYTYLFNHLPHIAGVEFGSDSGLYYIYNDTAKKVRYIVLDVNEIPYEMDEDGTNIYSREHSYSISQKQLSWLTDKALKFTEDGWSVMVFAHDFYLREERDEKYIKFLYELFDSYKKGEAVSKNIEQSYGTISLKADFSKYMRADIIGLFAGHYHADVIQKTACDIPVIFTDCAIMCNRKTERKDGEKSELPFDMESCTVTLS